MTLPPVCDKSLAFYHVLLRAIIPFLLVSATRFHEGRAGSMGSRALRRSVTCRSAVVSMRNGAFIINELIIPIRHWAAKGLQTLV